jgi:hypothetical protein
MEELSLNIDSIVSKEKNLFILNVKRIRNTRELHLLPSPIFLEANNLTRVPIQHNYGSFKT